MIIPPTWNKTAYHNQIGEIWQRAAREMGDAEKIFVIGYSLPDTDWFFNYLYGLGVDMETTVEGFYVYDPDMEAKVRFERLIGPGVVQRFQFNNYSFREAVSTKGYSLKTILNIL